MNKLMALMTALFISACSVAPVKLAPADATGLLFPQGTFHHDVEVKIAKIGRTISMKGVLSRKKDKLTIVGLSMFNSTLFKLEDSLQGSDPKLTIYENSLKKYQNQFGKVYGLIGLALKSEYGDLDEKGELRKSVEGKEVVVKFRDYDRIYKTVKIEHPDFVVVIKVSRYEV